MNKKIIKFINLGKAYEKSNSADGKQFLSEISSTDRLLGYRAEWIPIIEKLKTIDFVALLKGMTIAETHYKWPSGSASEIIWCFRKFESVAPVEILDETIKWIFENRWNDYLPFGTCRYRSYEDYVWHHSEEYLSLKREKQARHFKKMERLQREAACRKIEKDRLLKKHQEIGKVKAEKRKREIKKLEKINPEERLNYIGKNKSVTLDYFPAKFAEVSEKILINLSLKDRLLLMERIKYKQKGKWKILYKKLQKIEKFH